MIVIIATGLFAMRRLPWVDDARLSYDSIRYYAGAESILQRGVYQDLDGRPQRQWPPGMSLLYAFLSAATRLDPVRLVPIVNAAAFILTVSAFAMLVRLAGVRWWLGALSVAAVAWNGLYLSMQNKMWSELPSIALFIVTLLFLANALRRDARAGRWISLALVTTAGCIMFRYAFLALIPVLMLVAILDRRWIAAMAALLTPIPTLAAVFLLGASRGNRAFDLQAVQLHEFRSAIVAVGEQMFPRLLGGVAVVVLIVAAGFVIPLIFARTTGPGAAREVIGLTLLWTIAYTAFLLVAQMLISPQPIVDLRMLLPLYFTLVLAVAVSCEIAFREHRMIAVFLMASLLSASLRAGRFALFTIGRKGEVRNCVPRQWYVDAIRNAAPQGSIGSNAQGTVWLALRRPISTMADADTMIWIDSARACEGAVDLFAPRPSGSVERRNGLVILTRGVP